MLTFLPLWALALVRASYFASNSDEKMNPELDLGCDMNGLLQVSMEVEGQDSLLQQNFSTLRLWEQTTLSSLIAPFYAFNERFERSRAIHSTNAEHEGSIQKMFENFSNILVICMFLCLFVICFYLLLCGLPNKAPQHSSVKDGCSTSWIIFIGMIFTFTYFTTDQYVPSLPQMEIDLSGSQGLMSATVQMNFVVKALCSIITAGLSDRIGRRPTLMFCMCVLSLASFCCGCAGRIEWFVAARILQGIGESVEPVIFAITCDYFPKPEQRLGIVAALQMMSIGGMLVAPVAGGFLAEFFNWRFSFFVLAVVWGVMAIYAIIATVESCPDQECEGYLKDVSKILDPHLLCLLLTESCFLGAYLTFNANVSYFAEVVFNKSTMTSSMIMLTFGALLGLGLLFVKGLQLGSICSILRVAKIAVSLYASTGIISFLLGFFGEFFWAYLVGCFLQASTMMMTVVSVNVLFFEPLKDCAGMAASAEMCAKYIIPPFFSMMSTQSLIHSGAKGLIQFQASACIACGLIFSCFALWPPWWATDLLEAQNHAKLDD